MATIIPMTLPAKASSGRCPIDSLKALARRSSQENGVESPVFRRSSPLKFILLSAFA